MSKCPPFRQYEPRKHVKSFFHEKFWEASVQTTACGGDDLVLSSLVFWQKNGHLRT